MNLQRYKDHKYDDATHSIDDLKLCLDGPR